MRSKNSLKTMVYGFVLTGIIAILGLFKTKILLSYLGEDSVAIYQLFANIYTYLSLLDGGVTSAMIYYLYRPLREKNYEKTSELINGIREYFNKVGVIVIIIGIILSINISLFIKETALNNSYIQICCLIFIIGNAITYFVNSKTVLYEAEQRTYKYSNLNHGLVIVKGIIEIILASLGFDLLTLMVTFLGLSFIKNMILVLISKKDHTYIIKTKKIDTSFKKETNSLFIYKIAWLVFENIDVVLLSRFVGSKAIIVYTAYHQITNMFSLILKRISAAITPGIGDMLIDKDYKHIGEVFDEINSMLFYFGLIICIPLYFVLSPFIKLWYGSKYMSSNLTALFFILVLFTTIIGIVLEAFIKSSGKFKSIRNWAIYQSIVNLTISLLLVTKLGVLGVLIGTIFAFITGNFLSYPRIINREVIHRNSKIYYKNCLVYLTSLIPSLSVCLLINHFLSYNRLIEWFMNGTILFLVNFIIITGYFYLTKNLQFVNRLKNVLKHKV